MVITSNELALKRTKLANQRTYLSYMRTGFAIASIAGVFKKSWIVIFGIVMIIFSSIQYMYLNYTLTNNLNISNKFMDMVPVIYVFLSIGTLYLQFNNKK